MILDRRQAEGLARWIVEEHERLEHGLSLTEGREGAIAVHGLDEQGRQAAGGLWTLLYSREASS